MAVPTPAQRQGDFSGLVDSTGRRWHTTNSDALAGRVGFVQYLRRDIAVIIKITIITYATRAVLDRILGAIDLYFTYGTPVTGTECVIVATIPIREKMYLRLNADFFNVLNRPGVPQPGSNGVIGMNNSANSPRLLQLTLRFTW